MEKICLKKKIKEILRRKINFFFFENRRKGKMYKKKKN